MGPLPLPPQAGGEGKSQAAGEVLIRSRAPIITGQGCRRGEPPAPVAHLLFPLFYQVEIRHRQPPRMTIPHRLKVPMFAGYIVLLWQFNGCLRRKPSPSAESRLKVEAIFTAGACEVVVPEPGAPPIITGQGCRRGEPPRSAAGSRRPLPV